MKTNLGKIFFSTVPLYIALIASFVCSSNLQAQSNRVDPFLVKYVYQCGVYVLDIRYNNQGLQSLFLAEPGKYPEVALDSKQASYAVNLNSSDVFNLAQIAQNLMTQKGYTPIQLANTFGNPKNGGKGLQFSNPSYTKSQYFLITMLNNSFDAVFLDYSYLVQKNASGEFSVVGCRKQN